MFKSYILAKYKLLFFLDSCWESDVQEPTNIVPILGVRKERPWYHGFSDQTFYPRTCVDKSDRVFEVGQHCPSNDSTYNCTTYLGEVFPCPDDSPARNCWDSCDKPGPNCTTCTNTAYFHCTHSNYCLHPQLLCDGHPQYEHGEDEDLDFCHVKYKENKVISK